MDKSLRLKIKSDGTPTGTEVFTDNGEKFPLPVTSIDYHIDTGDVGTIKLSLYAYRASFEVTAQWPSQEIRKLLDEVQDLELKLKTLLAQAQ